MVKNPESACNAGDQGSIPGLGSSLREGNRLPGYPLLYSWASLVTQTVKNPPQCGRPWFNSWVGKIPWRRAWEPTPVSCLESSHGQRSLVGYSPQDHKESDMTEQLSKHSERKKDEEIWSSTQTNPTSNPNCINDLFLYNKLTPHLVT